MDLISRALAKTPIATGYPHYTQPPSGGGPVNSVSGFLGIMVAVIDFAQVAFWILAAGFGLYAAYLYLFSQGSKESLLKARNMLIYTVVAILLALIAYGIPALVTNFLFLGAASS